MGPFEITKKDVTIVCGTERFSFDESWLTKISTVFRDMIENCDVGTPEFKEDSFKPESIATLKNILEQKRIKVKEITSDLALFAIKYVSIVLLKVKPFSQKSRIIDHNLNLGKMWKFGQF